VPGREELLLTVLCYTLFNIHSPNWRRANSKILHTSQTKCCLLIIITVLTYPHRNGCGLQILHYSTDRLCFIVLSTALTYTHPDGCGQLDTHITDKRFCICLISTGAYCVIACGAIYYLAPPGGPERHCCPWLHWLNRRSNYNLCLSLRESCAFVDGK